MAKKKIKVTQVLVVLQGKVQSFEDYEKELNAILRELPTKVKLDSDPVVLPTADQSGRLCCVVNYRVEI